MDEKFTKRYESFKNSLASLTEARQRDMEDSFVLSGTSAKFSITFDLAWKVMKDILVQYYAITGFVAGSPREVLRESFKAELTNTLENLKNFREKWIHCFTIYREQKEAPVSDSTIPKRVFLCEK